MTMPSAQSAVNKLSDTIAAAAAPPVAFPRVARLSAFSGGFVEVEWMGDLYPCNGYLASYSPTVNDIVLIDFREGQLIVLGKLNGRR